MWIPRLISLRMELDTNFGASFSPSPRAALLAGVVSLWLCPVPALRLLPLSQELHHLPPPLHLLPLPRHPRVHHHDNPGCGEGVAQGKELLEVAGKKRPSLRWGLEAESKKVNFWVMCFCSSFFLSISLAEGIISPGFPPRGKRSGII